MDRDAFLKRRSAARGFTLPELLGVMALLAVLAAILFPMFQGMHPLPNGAVRDGSGKPLPGAVLCFRDPSGRVAATVTADDYGSFRQKGLDGLSHDPVDGFGLSYATRRTGAGTLYVFTPLGTHIATFRDEAGQPIPGLALTYGPDRQTWRHGYREPFQSVTGESGVVRIEQAPAGARFEFQSRDPRRIVERFQATVDGNTVRYAVTVTTPGTITGCLRDEDGNPLPGYKAFATVSPDLDHFDRWYADSLVTGANGRFRITNLRPRVYYVSVAPARGYHAAAPAKRVSLGPGQTSEVALRADTMDQTPDDH